MNLCGGYCHLETPVLGLCNLDPERIIVILRPGGNGSACCLASYIKESTHSILLSKFVERVVHMGSMYVVLIWFC